MVRRRGDEGEAKREGVQTVTEQEVTNATWAQLSGQRQGVIFGIFYFESRLCLPMRALLSNVSVSSG